jgi:ABC-2 type transport system ATP-binding protein
LRPNYEKIPQLRELSIAMREEARRHCNLIMIPNVVCIAGAFLFGLSSLAVVVLSNLGTYSPLPRVPDAMSLLEVSHLRKSYGRMLAVDDVSFHVEAGEIFGLVGPNGAGKSTTMMILAGLRQADGGEATIAGRAVGTHDQALQQMLGVVPQDLAIYADLTARENLDFFGGIYGLRGPNLIARIDWVLEQIGLTSHADQFVRTFSGGMKRRLNFGAALLHQPSLVILDEPTVGVDPQSRSHLLDCIRQLAASGVAVIYASHYMEEIEAICERVAIIDYGKILVQGTLEELVHGRYADLSVRVAASAAGVKNALSGLAEVVSTNGHESQAVIRGDRSAAAGAATDRLTRILSRLAEAKLEVLGIDTREHNLERLFLELTGRKLRD